MVLEILFLIGICVEAVTGAIAAGRKSMDFFGVIIIACITALGGGTVRDTLLNFHPLTWVAHPSYLLLTAACAIVTIVLAHRILRIMRVFLILDALGLAAFVILGTQKAMAHGESTIIIIISGMLTGICGGMLRDILCNDIPLVLRKELYAIIAMGGAILYLMLNHFQIHPAITIFITLTSIFGARVLAIIYHIEMAKFDYAKSIRKAGKRRSVRRK